MKRPKLLQVVFSALALMLFLLCAQVSAQQQQKRLPQPQYSKIQKQYIDLFVDIFGRVSQGYVDADKAQTEKLIFAAIRGMLEELDDPYSVFFAPSAYKNFKDSRQGQYYGIGVYVSKEDGGFKIFNVIEESPAWETGIHVNDFIIAVNGISTEGLSQDEVSTHILGKVDTLLKVTVARGQDKKIYHFTLKRRELIIKSVYYNVFVPPFLKSKQAGSTKARPIGYIRIHHFVQNTDEELKRVLAIIKDQRVSGIVIDLRNNPGGFLNTAINMVDHFISEGVIVSTRDRYGHNAFEYANKKIAFPKFIPLAILVNKYSASASEVFAGALRDHGRAAIVGEQTFGKFSVQQEFPYTRPQQVGFKMTIARYILPSGQAYSQKGIPVDVKVTNHEMFSLASLEARYHAEDLQLKAALELLNDRKRYQAFLKVTAKEQQK